MVCARQSDKRVLIDHSRHCVPMGYISLQFYVGSPRSQKASVLPKCQIGTAYWSLGLKALAADLQLPFQRACMDPLSTSKFLVQRCWSRIGVRNLCLNRQSRRAPPLRPLRRIELVRAVLRTRSSMSAAEPSPASQCLPATPSYRQDWRAKNQTHHIACLALPSYGANSAKDPNKSLETIIVLIVPKKQFIFLEYKAGRQKHSS